MECLCQGQPLLELTGTWQGDDGAIYYLRQIGSQLWWAGFSVDSSLGASDLHWGLRFSNVFQGQVSGDTITGDWADVPKGSSLNSGTLTLNGSANQLQRQSETGGFGATLWNRIAPAYPPPTFDRTLFGDQIFTLFQLVKKNRNSIRDHTLLDNLKPAKTRASVVFGTISQAFPNGQPDPDAMHVNYPPNLDRCYSTYACLSDYSDLDADIDFNLQVDRPNLDSQINFWSSDGWETGSGVNPGNFRNKLDFVNPQGNSNQLHIESIMFGGTTECREEGTTYYLLPGWQQPGAQSVLLNGRPIAGQLDFSDTGRSDGAFTIHSLLGRTPKIGDRVRLTGILALDCGHGWEHDCDEDVASTQDQEMHPLYAIDFIQDFTFRQLGALLTGVWSANDAGTYYVHQIGNTVWWLGLSADEGKSFANVFRGTLQNGQVSGNWADIPLGQTANSGPLTLSGNQGQVSTTWTRVGDAGAFSGSAWQKLYDTGVQQLVIVWEGATVNRANFPATPEPFEVQVGSHRVEVKPTNARPVAASKGSAGAKRKASTQADLGARLPLDIPPVGPIPVAVSFAGYRAHWTIPQENLKPGEHVQVLNPPKNAPPLAATSSSKQQVADRDLQPVRRHAPAAPMPRITIRYRIEPASVPAPNPAPKAEAR
jgi:hypothetical protein